MNEGNPAPAAPAPAAAPAGAAKSVDKNLHTWVFAFLLGGFGVDRFMRGQIGLGVVKLLFGWCTMGLWALIDWIIALMKAYGDSYKNDKEFTFGPDGKYLK